MRYGYRIMMVLFRMATLFAVRRLLCAQIKKEHFNRCGNHQNYENRKNCSNSNYHITYAIIAFAASSICHKEIRKNTNCNTPHCFQNRRCLIANFTVLRAKRGDSRNAVVGTGGERNQHNKERDGDKNLRQRKLFHEGPNSGVSTIIGHNRCDIQNTINLPVHGTTAENAKPDNCKHARHDPVDDHNLANGVAICKLSKKYTGHRRKCHPERPVINRPPLKQCAATHCTGVKTPKRKILQPVSDCGSGGVKDICCRTAKNNYDGHEKHIESEVQIGEELNAFINTT